MFRIKIGAIVITLCMMLGMTSNTIVATSASMIAPPLLKKGDKIAVVAPSFYCFNTNKVIRKVTEVFNSWGLEVIIGKSVRKRFYLFSGQDNVRKSDLQQMLDDPTIKAVIAIRGGYGMTRIVDKIDFKKFIKSPKWVIGFSDITTLLAKLAHFNIISIHGEMPSHFLKKMYQSSIASLQKLLFTGKLKLKAATNKLNRRGTTIAPVVGGNLTTICNNIGTDSELDTTGKILLLEDIGEELYAIDRMMVQLKRAGKLSSLKGLIVGDMGCSTNHNPISFGKNAYAVIKEHVTMYNYPVAFNFPIGHITPNIAILHGGTAILEVTEEESLLDFSPL